jgi:hypothetical protein
MRYYWPTMVADCENHAKKYRMCQIHGLSYIKRKPITPHGSVLGIQYVGHGYSGTHKPSHVNRSLIHFGGHRLFYQVGRSRRAQRG